MSPSSLHIFRFGRDFARWRSLWFSLGFLWLSSLPMLAQAPASPGLPRNQPGGKVPEASTPAPAVTPPLPAGAVSPATPGAGEQGAPAQPAAQAMTAQEFLRLWEETKLEDKLQRQRPPAQGVIRSASYVATVAGPPGKPSGLTVEANLEVQSLQKGWSLVPISSEPLPLVKSETGNAFLTLRDQGYLVLLPEEGTYRLQLSLVFPVDSVEGIPTAAIQLPQSPVSSFSGKLAGLGWSVKTSRNLFPIRTSAEGNDTSYSFSPGANTSFQLQWETPEDDKAKQPVIFADTEVNTLIRPDAVRSEAKVTLQLPRAPIRSLQISLSPDHELLTVSGDAIKSWTLEKREKHQVLEVWFAAPRQERCQLQLLLEQALAQLPASASLPSIRVEGALRQGGAFEVVEEQDVTSTLDGLQQLTRQASGFHPAANQRHLGSYRFLRNDYAASLKIVETTPQIGVTADTLFHIDDRTSSFVTTLRLDIQGRAILQSAVVLPAGFELGKVSGDSVRGFELKGNRLAITYSRPQLGTVQVELTGKKTRREGGVEEQELPHFTVENAQEFRGRIRLEFPPSIQLDVRNEASPMVLRPAPGSFEYVNTPFPSSLVVTRKAPHVEVVSSTEIHFQHHETSIRSTLDFQIRNRFPERLLLRVPSSLAAKVEFKSPTLRVMDRQASPAAAAAASRAEDDSLYTYWALHDPNETLGEHHVELTIADKLPDPLYNQPLITASLLIVPVQADRLDGKIAISTDENVVLKPMTQNGLRTVSVEPATPGSGPAFEFTSNEADLTFAVTRLRYVELPSLAVDLADVTHVVSGDGSISSEVAYRIIADQPADLEIQLPPGAQMNSQVFCNDAPIAPRQTTEENLVAVTIHPEKKGKPEGDTIVRFTYDVPSPLASKSLGDRGELPIPVASLRNAKTLDSRTTLYLPPAFRYFGFATPMTLESKVLGWNRAKAYLARLVPSLAAWMNQGGEVAELAVEVSPIPAFEYRIPLRKEGQKFTFVHSAAPDAATVSYISQRYATLLEAGGFFLALFLGILLSRKPIEAKLVFLVFGGALALVAASFAAPHLAAIYQAVCLGAVSSVIFWLFAGVIGLFRGLSFRSPAAEVPQTYPPFSQAPESEPRFESPLPEEPRAEPEPSRPEPARVEPVRTEVVRTEPLAGNDAEKAGEPETSPPDTGAKRTPETAPGSTDPAPAQPGSASHP